MKGAGRDRRCNLCPWRLAAYAALPTAGNAPAVGAKRNGLLRNPIPKGKETMRRGLLLTMATALLGAVMGCKTHGVCDCRVTPIYEGPMPPASGHVGSHHSDMYPYNASEPIQVAPQAGH
jgi:hypothetical protein